ncbi:MAG: NAD-dependent epimerase/dehydratase family protein [Deltaproteobacteria bacterium]|nr:NAD-dependent epimerase/dehydratase family protein [Deltaproteobacteria bacterium]
MRVLVTGATGFIGFHAAARLRADGHDVRALVRSREKGEGLLAPLGVASHDLVVGDMTDRPAIEQALEGCDAVIHAAAGVSVTTRKPDFSANLRGTQAVVGAACERGCETLYVSSLAALFDPKRRIGDDSPLVQSRTEYGRSKAASDAWVRTLQDAGARLGIVYPPGVVGPDDPGFSESVKAYRSFLRSTLKSSGGIQLVDVRDLALLLERMLERRARGRVVAAGHFFDWDGFTALLERVTGTRISRVAAPGWLLRVAARGFDVVGKLTGRPMPMSGEGVEIATRWPDIADSPRVAELGVSWRPADETLADLFRWFVAVGRLPASAVPALGGGSAGQDARG